MTRLSEIIREQARMPPMPGQAEPMVSGPFRSVGAAVTPAPSPSIESAQSECDWYCMAEEELSRLAESVQRQEPIQLEALSRIATGITESLQHNDRLIKRALTGATGSQLITHPVNVAILATKLGMGLGYRLEELGRLALTGLLHDVGMFLLPESLVFSSDKLSQEDNERIEQHPELGYQVMSKLGDTYEWLAQVVRQEHERWRAQGYPNRLKGTEIHEYAQIIGLVDVFDALVSPRPYRQRMLPHEAMRELLMVEKNAFSHRLIKALVEQLSFFPLGTMVRLNTGEVGIVTQLNPRHPLRPIVQVNQTTDRTMPAGSMSVDLSQTTQTHIVEALKPVEAG